jgi:hypothetical protein
MVPGREYDRLFALAKEHRLTIPNLVRQLLQAQPRVEKGGDPT